MKYKFSHFKRDFSQWSIYLIATSLFISIPLITILIYLFNGAGEMWNHILQYFLLDYIKNSVILLIGTGILTSFMGISTAWIITNYNFKFKKIIEWLLFLPLAIPSYITAYAYVGLLGNGGTVILFLKKIGFSIQKIEMMNVYGLIWVLSFSLFPYVYVSAKTIFKSFPNQIKETVTLLGVSNKKYFFSVALPLASPAIIGGLFLVFMEVLNDYGAAKYYGVNTFTTGIFRTWTALEDIQSAIYLSALLVILVLLINFLTTWVRRKKSYTIRINNNPNSQLKLKKLKGKKKFIYLLILVIPILFGFLLPTAQLIYWSYFTAESLFSLELIGISLQSFFVALTATFFIILSALALIYFSRWNYFKNLSVFKKIATIGYVIPGAIIGIGIIRSNQSVINFFYHTFDLKVGFLFYGSSIILIYAYVFRFLAVAFNPIYANTLKLGKYLHESSYLLGKSKLKTLLKIELPLLKNTIISAFVLVFIDILKELPLTLILKPYHLKTLASKAFEYADDERLPEAAPPALLLIIVIALLMVLLSFLNRKRTTKETQRNE